MLHTKAVEKWMTMYVNVCNNCSHALTDLRKSHKE